MDTVNNQTLVHLRLFKNKKRKKLLKNIITILTTKKIL